MPATATDFYAKFSSAIHTSEARQTQLGTLKCRKRNKVDRRSLVGTLTSVDKQGSGEWAKFEAEKVSQAGGRRDCGSASRPISSRRFPIKYRDVAVFGLDG